jgi:hypothetical protein
MRLKIEAPNNPPPVVTTVAASDAWDFTSPSASPASARAVHVAAQILQPDRQRLAPRWHRAGIVGCRVPAPERREDATLPSTRNSTLAAFENSSFLTVLRPPWPGSVKQASNRRVLPSRRLGLRGKLALKANSLSHATFCEPAGRAGLFKE